MRKKLKNINYSLYACVVAVLLSVISIAVSFDYKNKGPNQGLIHKKEGHSPSFSLFSTYHFITWSMTSPRLMPQFSE